MRQRIMHGKELDTATPTEVAAIIAHAFDRQRELDFHRHKGSIQLDGTGAGTDEIHLSRQWNWILERIALTGAANTIIQFMGNGTQGTDLLEVIQLGSGGLYSGGVDQKLFIPAGTRLFVVVTGGGASGQLTYNLQARLIPADK